MTTGVQLRLDAVEALVREMANLWEKHYNCLDEKLPCPPVSCAVCPYNVSTAEVYPLLRKYKMLNAEADLT